LAKINALIAYLFNKIFVQRFVQTKAMVRVIGLISGTSVDGIDAALVEISGNTDDLQVTLIDGATYPYPEPLRAQILAVCGGAPLSVAELATLDDAIAHAFAEAALAIQAGHSPTDLIGSHGQTVYHRPPALTETGSPQLGYSLQLGRGALIADLTHITTVSNFRAADIAVGGQGAPMVPPVDICLLQHPTLNRCVQNIGGIGNVAYIPAKTPPSPSPQYLGWDTGPGNVLLDLATQHLSGGRLQYDQDGAWAAAGKPCQKLVQQWLQQDFFRQPPPKSTGRELFSPDYLAQCFHDAAEYNLSDADILATLTELTAASIAHNYCQFLPQLPDQVLLCGGGSRNLYLKQRLQANLESALVCTTDEVGLSADFKEAMAFAVLAYWRCRGIPGNLPDVTGAKRSMLLGEIYQGYQDSA
jgi:anhydro-N-acetylmuramic acid kinase